MPRYTNQQVSLYNSITSKKEILNPITKGNIGMYVCGPTVYSDVHMGNVRTFVSFDIIFRYLKHLGYKVRYVRNVTDAGHLENDIDSGEDKIAKKARLEQIEPMEVVQRYTIGFHEVLEKLNCLPPSIEPTATGHIIEQIEIIKDIISKGFAYEISGSVYFDVVKFNEAYSYGKLSNRKIEDLISNTRDLEGQLDKKNLQDFALWKKAEPQHIMRWVSPWGDGFPGWHLECTAMSTKYLGKKFDIHGGGMDLKFPHHECEIAQSEVIGNENPVSYWLHTNMLTLNGKKMSKSTGNSILPNEIFDKNNDMFDKAFSPSVIRFFMLQAHYRSILDISNDAILASEKGYNRLMESVKSIKDLKVSSISSFEIDTLIQKCYDAMNDDFNTPILIAQLFEISKLIFHIKEGKEVISEIDLKKLQQNIDFFICDVLGLKLDFQKDESVKFSEVMSLLIELRNQARENKDFFMSDKIRDKLIEMGIHLKDGKDGTIFYIA